jgi:nicotinate-nucleotide adenylyltransferase
MSRVGVFGGQFDPPHKGHLAVIRAARDQVPLDTVLVMPDAHPPHRAPSNQPARIRFRLAQAAFDGEPGVEVVRPQLHGGLEYAVDTLERLAPRGPLFLIIGADQHARFDTWRDPDRIRALATLVVAPRTGFRIDDPAAIVLDMPPVDLASTELRECLQAGEDCSDRVPAGAWELVARDHLYR